MLFFGLKGLQIVKCKQDMCGFCGIFQQSDNEMAVCQLNISNGNLMDITRTRSGHNFLESGYKNF